MLGAYFDPLLITTNRYWVAQFFHSSGKCVVAHLILTLNLRDYNYFIDEEIKRSSSNLPPGHTAK